MTGLYIFGILIAVGVVALVVFKIKSHMADRTLARRRREKIEEERIEEVARVEALGKK